VLKELNGLEKMSYYGQVLVVLRVTIFGGFDFMSVKRIKWIGENELLW
jgi:hypothetical protein